MFILLLVVGTAGVYYGKIAKDWNKSIDEYEKKKIESGSTKIYLTSKISRFLVSIIFICFSALFLYDLYTVTKDSEPHFTMLIILGILLIIVGNIPTKYNG